MPSHTFQAYDEELKFLATKIAAMGGQAERMVEDYLRVYEQLLAR